MQRLLIGIITTLLAWPAGVHGQLTVRVRLERDTFLLYESIPATVSIQNLSGRALELAGNDGGTWLKFLITDPAGRTVAAVGPARHEESLLIPAGESLSRAVDLLPRYDLRTHGTYRVQALVDSGPVRVSSLPASFNIMRGRELWSQTIGLPSVAPQPEQSRTYSLITRRDGLNDVIYVGVRDDAHDLVYAMLPLGVYVALGEPEAKTDSLGLLHVLFRNGPRSFHYAQVDPQGHILEQAVYSNVLSTPHLRVSPVGAISVAGGEKTYPRVERVMTDEELRPPPPPKPPPKKSWWPFHRHPNPPPPPATNAPPAAAAAP